MVPILKTGYLAYTELAALSAITPLIRRLAHMIVMCYYYDFSWIVYEDPF